MKKILDCFFSRWSAFLADVSSWFLGWEQMCPGRSPALKRLLHEETPKNVILMEKKDSKLICVPTSIGYRTRWPGRLPPSSSRYPCQLFTLFTNNTVIWKKKTVHFQLVTSQFSTHFPLTNELQASVCGDIWKVCNYRHKKYRVSLKKRSLTRLAPKPLHKALLVLKMVHNDEDQSKTP